MHMHVSPTYGQGVGGMVREMGIFLKNFRPPLNPPRSKTHGGEMREEGGEKKGKRKRDEKMVDIFGRMWDSGHPIKKLILI